jgi:hypothetical protein
VEPWWADAELEWISRRRQCRQLVAWFGKLAEYPGRRRATIVRASDDFIPHVKATVVGQPNVESTIAPKIGRFIFEPDPAVLAAKLEGGLAVQEGLQAIAPNLAYFTGDAQTNCAAFDTFEVLEVLPYRVKPLRQWLATRKLGRLEIKKRGIDLDPAKVCGDLTTDGAESATILLAKIGGRVIAIVARRLANN